MSTTCPATPGRTDLARRVAVLTVSLSFAGLLGAVPASAAGTVAASADPTDGADGRVSAIVRVGSRIFIGGSFTTVGGLPRRGLAALNADTGAVDPNWSADVVGEVRALASSPAGGGIYVGGTFSSIRGVPRENLAAVTTATGTVSPFNPGANSTVLALTSYSRSVLVGGRFTRIGGYYVLRLAMLDAVTSRPNSRFQPRPDAAVSALQLSPGRTGVYVGGTFTRIAGQAHANLAGIVLANGLATNWYPQAASCPVLGAAMTTGGSRLYVACGGAGNAVASYNTAASGPRLWSGLADGNVQTVTLLGTTLYAGGHFTQVNGLERRKVAAFDYSTGALQPWAPALDSPLGVWALCAGTNGLWAGGDFTTVNDTPQPHIAFFRQVG